MRPSLLRHAPWITLGTFLGPVAVGLAGTLLPAFGYLPALDGRTVGLEPWRMLLDDPSLASSIRLAATTGITATVLAVVLSIGILAWWQETRTLDRLRNSLAPLLAVPHAAVAFGLAFLIAPSGWILRVLSPWATGLARPPDLALAPDPFGIALVIGLVMKEVPFLLLMSLAALERIQVRESVAVARSLGYTASVAWLKAVLPRLYPQIRLPVYAVLAYSLSVVDMAVILAPGTPPPLAVLVLRWSSDPDLALRFQAAAGALVQTLLVVAAIAAWRGAEIAVAAAGRAWLTNGDRGPGPNGHRVAKAGFGLAAAGIGTATGLGLAGMGLWSVARVWKWPEALPGQWTFERWTHGIATVAEPLVNTATLGLASAAAALVLAVACLENESRSPRKPGHGTVWLLYVPLLAPQVGFLFGVQVLLIVVGLDGTWIAVAWSHLLFVLPYVFLTLADPYRAFDPRYERTALCLGAGRMAVFRRVKAPMLARPLLAAFAVGFSVSVAQYLPTVYAGAGRIPTLTSEAVSLAAGSNRGLVGVQVALQSLLPLVVFAFAAGLAGRLGRPRPEGGTRP